MVAPSKRSYVVGSVCIALDVLEKLADILPVPAKLVFANAQNLIKVAEAVKTNREDCIHLRDHVLTLLPRVMLFVKSNTFGPKKGELPQDVKENVDKLCRNLQEILDKLNTLNKVVNVRGLVNNLKVLFKVVSGAKAHGLLIQSCKDDLNWAMTYFATSNDLANTVRLCDIAVAVDQLLTRTVLSSLPYAQYASCLCERPDLPRPCFRDTRKELLESVLEWARSSNPSVPPIFWLNGIAGTGKSAIARTFADAISRDGRLGADFFFNGEHPDLRNPALVFTTIAYQLARFDFVLGEYIVKALLNDSSSQTATIEEQLKRLLITPLSGAKRDPERTVVIILDALDECDAGGASRILKSLLTVIKDQREDLPFTLKLFITSRPESHITTALAGFPSSLVTTIALHEMNAENDMRWFLTSTLGELREEREPSLPSDWVKKAEVDMIVEKAGNLFLYADIAMRFLSESNVDSLRDQFNELITIVGSKGGISHGHNPFEDLDELYKRFLQSRISRARYVLTPELLQQVLGSLASLRAPIPQKALENLTGIPHAGMESALRNLHSVVIPGTDSDSCPLIYHSSFLDFLRDRNRCTDAQFWIDIPKQEEVMAAACLTVLNELPSKPELHGSKLGPSLMNADVEDLEERIGKTFSREELYSCRYWASHLSSVLVRSADGEVRDRNPGLVTMLESFVLYRLLPWLEVMSWLGETHRAAKCLDQSKAWAAASRCPSKIVNILNDAYRLLLAHFATITCGALHIARSVLPFSPQVTYLAATYKDYASDCIRVIRGGDLAWSPCIMTLNSHLEKVQSIVFSHDGGSIASGSSDTTVRVWDTASGTTLQTLEGHAGSVMAVAFSPDGSRVASCSLDGTVQIWDATTGRSQAVFRDHKDQVTSVVFSHDGSHIASGSDDYTVRVWRVVDGALVATLTGYSKRVTSVAFSPCGTPSQVASGSVDTKIRIWDKDRNKTRILHGHLGAVRSVVFSPDGQWLASGSTDKTIKIWHTGPPVRSCLKTLRGHSGEITCVVFSGSGDLIASGSEDHTVRVWSTAGGINLATLTEHTDCVTSVSFSPDGTRVASGSNDMTVKVWTPGPHTGAPLVTLEGHVDGVTSVAFAPNGGGTRIASSSNDNTVRVWDATAGLKLAAMQNHVAEVIAVAFSNDGTRIASASRDKTVRIWDAATGETLLVFKDEDEPTTSLKFSSDGRLIASLSDQRRAAVWDALSGNKVEIRTRQPNRTMTFPVPTGHSVRKRDKAAGRLSGDGPWWEIQPIKSQVATFKVDDGRLYKVHQSRKDELVCVLPSFLNVTVTASYEVGACIDRVVLGCTDGQVAILDVKL